MELTQEQKNRVLAAVGKKPWEADIRMTPDGGVDIVPVETKPSSALGVGLAQFAQEEAPRAVVGAAGGTMANALAAPVIGKATAALGGPMTPAGLTAGLVGGALTFGTGAAAANAALDRTHVLPWLRQQITGSEQQNLRDQMEHPTATRVARAIGNLSGFKLLNPRALMGGLRKIANPWRAASGTLLADAEREAVANLGANVVMGGGVEAVRQAKEGEFRPGDIAVQAAMGAPFGAPRAVPAAAGELGAAFVKGVGRWLVGKKGAPTTRNFPPLATTQEPAPAAPDVDIETYYGDAPDINKVTFDLREQPEALMRRSIQAQLAGRPYAFRNQPPRVKIESGPAADVKFVPPDPVLLDPGTIAGPPAPELTHDERIQQNVERNLVTRAAEQQRAEASRSARALADEQLNAANAAYQPSPPAKNLHIALGNVAADPVQRLVMRTPAESRPTGAVISPSETLTPGRTEAELLQDYLERTGAKYQPAQEGASDLKRGRELLRRRGFNFSETSEPILNTAGEQQAGMFDPTTGKITVDPTVAGPDTHAHEGMHAELQDMALSEDPRVSSLGQDLIVASNGEENLASAGGRTAVSPESRLLRLLKMNWAYLRQRFGGKDMTPETAARILSERFETQVPGPVKPLSSEPKFQPAQRLAQDPEFVPLSIIAQIGRRSPETAAAIQDFAATARSIFGKHFGNPVNQLAKMDPELVNTTLWKRSRAGQLGQVPQFTPAEQAVNDLYQQVMDETAAAATAAGYPIQQRPYYVPEMLSQEAARKHQSDPTYLQTLLPEYHALNQAVYKNTYDPQDAELYLHNYLEGAALSPNSLGSDFGALTKSAREYHLPDSIREYDQIRALERYGRRYARQLAKRQEIESSPEAMAALGYDRVPFYNGETIKDLRALTDEARNARYAVDDVLFNQGRGSSGLSQNTKDVITAAQQLAYSGALQTLSGLRNSVQTLATHFVHLASPADVQAFLRGHVEAFANYQTQLTKAIAADVVRPGRDPNTQWEEFSVASRLAHNMRSVALKIRKLTGADFLETANRVKDYTIGEMLAEVNIPLAKQGDSAAVSFINKFGAGVKDTTPLDEAVAKIAANYAIAIQGSYGFEGLPAPLLKGGTVAHLGRIQRFGFENMSRVVQYTLKPAAKGDYRPLLAYLFGLSLSAPVLQKLTQAITGAPSGLPTSLEIEKGKKRNPTVETALNLMALAQITGAFGFAGGVSGAIAQNARGNQQGLIGDPSITVSLNAIQNAGAAAEAIRQGEPVVPALMEAAQRTIVDNMQMLRRFKYDSGEREDIRNKRVFEYATARREIPLNQMVGGLLTGSLLGHTPEISPTKEAARHGDRAAKQLVPRDERARLNNYRGGYEDPTIEHYYRRFLKSTQGPEELDAYIKRRKAARRPQAVP